MWNQYHTSGFSSSEGWDPNPQSCEGGWDQEHQRAAGGRDLLRQELLLQHCGVGLRRLCDHQSWHWDRWTQPHKDGHFYLMKLFMMECFESFSISRLIIMISVSTVHHKSQGWPEQADQFQVLRHNGYRNIRGTFPIWLWQDLGWTHWGRISGGWKDFTYKC